MKRLKINVKQEHIDKGVRGYCTTCAMALAVTDTALPGGRKIAGASIRTNESSFVLEGRRVRFRMPVRATRFVRLFDKLGAHAVQPSTFYISVPDGEL